MPIETRASAAPWSSCRIGCNEREVQGEEEILDHDDPEDHARLGITEPPEFDEELGRDRRRRDADCARDDQRFAVAPSEREAEREPAADVGEEEQRAGATNRRPPLRSSSTENSRPR